jgi:sulfatase maturation enzyme AslB (radical SAM superfamily)
MALIRHVRRLKRRVRQARFFVGVLKTPYRPILAHLIPTRRCNLACTYCNEFDDHSAPVPAADLFRRIDRLAGLGTGIVTLSGGEPLLHPDADAIISHIRAHGMIATLITNGYLLTEDRIRRLNRAGSIISRSASTTFCQMPYRRRASRCSIANCSGLPRSPSST